MKIVILLALLVILVFQQNINLGQRERVQLVQDINYSKNYTLTLTEADLKKFNQDSSDKWFLFIDLQPINNVTWIQTYVDLYVLKSNGQAHHKKKCVRHGSQLQTCYLTNKDFDFKNDKIITTVASDQAINITLRSQISSLYKLDLNICLQLDYQKQAFSKMFQLNLQNLVQFKQIRIFMTPINQLYAGQPINLYANIDKTLPTATKFLFHAFDIWDYGKGLVIDSTDLKQAKKLNILIDAPQHYIYNLQTQIVMNFQPVNIKVGQKYHDVMEMNAMRDYNFKFDNKTSKQNYIRVKNYFGLAYVIGFRAGKISKNRTQLEDLAQLVGDQLLSEINYQIAQGISQLSVTINSMHFISTFTLQAYEAKSSINELVQGSARINQVANNQKIFYVARIVRFKQDNIGNSKARFQIRTQTGRTEQKLYYCQKDQIQNCKKWIQTYEIDGKQNKNITQFPSLGNLSNQHRNIYLLEIEENYFSDYDQKHKQAIIFVQIMGKDSNINSTISVVFRNIGIMYSLSQQEIKSDKMQSGQINFYKFSVANAQGVDQLNFYYSIYYGKVDFYLTDQNPTQKSQTQLTQFLKKQQPRWLHRSQNHLSVKKVQSNKSYYVVALSFSESYFVINPQVVRNISSKNLNISFSIIQITDQSDFKYLFQPQTLHIFEFKPIGIRYLIYLQSSLPLDVCFQYQNNKAEYPIQPDCDKTKTIGKGSPIMMNAGLMKNKVGIKNFHNKTTQLSIKLYSDWDKCVFPGMGQKTIIKTSHLQFFNLTSACAIFKIQRKGQILITAKRNNPILKNNFYIQIKIGEQQFVHLTNQQNILNEQQIDQSCKGEYEWCFLHIELTPFQQTDKKQFYNQQISLWVQYTDQPILLEDGISFTSKGIITKTSPRYFKYLINQIQDDITFILQNKFSYYKAYLKLQYFQSRFSYPKPEDVLNSNETYQTTNQMLSIYHTTIIKSQVLKQKCMTQGDRYCVLLISIYPLNRDEIQDGKFRVEITQFVSQLYQHTPSIGYLEKNSLAFYEFENLKQGKTISIFANTKNQHCLSIFAKEGIKVKATNSNSDKAIRNAPQLIIPDAKAQKYSITLQASKNCQYHLQVSTFQNKFSIIKKGYSIDLDLKAGQQKYLLFENQLKSTFRVMTLFSKSSQILIKAFATKNDDQLQQFISTTNTSLFSQHSYDWQDRNSLRIDVNNSKFCQNCYYVIRVQALKDVLGQLTIPSWDQQITIKADSFIYDQLYKGQKSIYRAYTTSHINLELQLQSGMITLKVLNKQTNNVISQRNYSSFDSLTIQSIVLQNDLSYDYFRYTYFELYCVENSHFVFSVTKGTKQEGQQAIDDPYNNKVLNFMHFGIPKEVTLKKNKKFCINGVMQEDPTFLISSKENIKSVKIQKVFTSGNKNLSISVTQLKSGMIVKLQNPKKINELTYEFCFTSQKQLKLTIIQSAYINYLPQNTDFTVTDNSNLTFMANGSTILQIGQCSGRAILSVSKDFKSAHQIGSQIKQFRKSNNLIEFNFEGMVYVQSHMSNKEGLTTLAWRQKNQQKGIGVGYDFFYSSNFRIFQSPDNGLYSVTIQIQPLKKYETNSQKLPFRTTKISYEIYVGKDESQLLSNINCHFKKPIISKDQDLSLFNQPLQIKLFSQQLDALRKQYNKNSEIFINVIAKINTQTTYGSQESYRFSYPYHQLSLTPTQPIIIGEPQVIIIHEYIGKYMIWFLVICLIVVGIFFSYRYYLAKKRRNILLNRQAINTIVQAELVDGMTINDEQ